ncbi:hypothetical protein ACGFNU_24255 [Spirillospora sp. NPDC048911]|uniref:hypothetical protein n=1 Tax=Spirillospora sp. NPDC048911 TaxID=3364527 RepID=UPI00371CE688
MSEPTAPRAPAGALRRHARPQRPATYTLAALIAAMALMGGTATSATADPEPKKENWGVSYQETTIPGDWKVGGYGEVWREGNSYHIKGSLHSKCPYGRGGKAALMYGSSVEGWRYFTTKCGDGENVTVDLELSGPLGPDGKVWFKPACYTIWAISATWGYGGESIERV